jgi:hypothetical protein
MTGRCGDCRHWKRKGETLDGVGRGVCWDQVPAAITRDDEGCGAFLDKLANRAEVEAWRQAARGSGA